MPRETFFNLSPEKQEKVMRSAVREFLNKGYEKGNIGDIAKNAEVSKGSMYQYFENKRELFMYTVQWSLEIITKKSEKYLVIKEDMDIFDYMLETSKGAMMELRDEREIVIFIEDIFLGKYPIMKGEPMEYIMKGSEEYLLNFIQEGKKNGYIRRDIQDEIILLFISGASIKCKEYVMNKARLAGEDIIDEAFEAYEKETKQIIDLLKNGMGVK